MLDSTETKNPDNFYPKWYSRAFLPDEAVWRAGVQAPQSPLSVMGKGSFQAACVTWAKHSVDVLLPGYKSMEDKGTEQLIDLAPACPVSKQGC